MSNLHQRPITPPEAAKEKDPTPAPLLKRQAPTAPSKPPLSWGFKLLYAVVALSTLAYFSPRHDSNIFGTYAVCAGKRKGIFTVDEQNTQVDCMLVEGPFVRDTGSLRAFSPPVPSYARGVHSSKPLQMISVQDGRRQVENLSPFATSPQALSLCQASVVRPPPSTPSLANVLHRFALPYPGVWC